MSADIEKHYISADDQQKASFDLAWNIVKSGFRPDYIVGVWRGGTPVGITVQEVLEYNGIKTDHIAIRTSSYDGMVRTKGSVQVHGLGYIVDKVEAEDHLLIVDDVFDSGLSIDAIIEELRVKTRKNMPQVKVATLYYKPKFSKVNHVPDFYMYETEQWLVFPHEMMGLTEEELKANKPEAVANKD